MMKDKIYIGNTATSSNDMPIEGGFEVIGNEKFYKISNYNQMPDFFMSIVSDSDHWMYISSNGSLSAGRKDRDNALFPYYSVDKIHDYTDITGSKTIVLVENNGQTHLWKPFSKALESVYNIERNIFKSIYGNKLIFEEINHDLGVCFRYSWNNSDKYGFVKKSEIENIGSDTIKIEILDGIRNILPYGLDYTFQNEYSNLLDAYKKCELQKETSLGIYSLSSIPVDRAEPSESLLATTVWSTGLSNPTILISDKQLSKFEKGYDVETEIDVRAARGAYYLNKKLEIETKQKQAWFIVADINKDSAAVADLNQFLNSKKDFSEDLNKDIAEGTLNLKRIVANADGLQISKEELCAARHFSNTLYNVMRGGIYLNNYTIKSDDFKKFLYQTNKDLAVKYDSLLNDFSEDLSFFELDKIIQETKDLSLIRVCSEYLPLTFSRRHGDPSRPWNVFSIDTKNEDGSPKSDYQGNWRDIFQNWEALSISYPGFIENTISKFLNSSTADGYNPYRVMRNGVDWECPDPSDPWAYIGYWGDHQIIYLQKLIELSDKYHPGKLDILLESEIYAYTNVPYRIKSYNDIVKNPQDTILFDAKLNGTIDKRVEEIGADGRLLLNSKSELIQVNLTEKILVTLLTKLSNFIPEAGIWLNTQRPEWNDANNALVGNGVSMVTLYYLHRFLKFWNNQFSSSLLNEVTISEEVNSFFDKVFILFASNTALLEKGFLDTDRREFTDALGMAGNTYRDKIYDNSFSGVKKTIAIDDLVAFTSLGLQYTEQSIQANRRDDGMYHAYNLIRFGTEDISIRYLYEMLEGQVAVLSSGYLSIEESIQLLDALKSSALFREDQYSYILYPDRDLPRFVDKNIIPSHRISESKLLNQLLSVKDTSIIQKDASGNYHFNSAFRNADVLKEALSKLKDKTGQAVSKKEKDQILAIFEEIFDHQSFTGRSGTFFGYEGLGSIYWHMVSKLLLAVQECFFKAVDEKADEKQIGILADYYYEIKAGIGLYKSPELYGAFPTDAYSHTPANAGAKQPGMTGQVKEDVISRMTELGVRIEKGKITFDLSLINKEELLLDEKTHAYFSIDGLPKTLSLKENQLGFTLCQVPVVYTLSDTQQIAVLFKNGEKEAFVGNTINRKTSAHIFNRNNDVERIEVSVKE